jgi:hypothetical protein
MAFAMRAYWIVQQLWKALALLFQISYEKDYMR